MAEASFLNRHLVQRSILSYLLFPVSLLYSLAIVIRRKLYKSVIRSFVPPVFTISVGNIIVGGSGKTPFTIFLAEYLCRQGLHIGISHRGYRSELENKVTLISDRLGLLPDAEKAGDESWLLATRLRSVPVVVGRNRKTAIQLICSKYPDLDCLILDDSFQHLSVQHDLDFVIINNFLRFGNGFTLPAGLLREPISALNSADCLVINQTIGVMDATTDLEEQLRPFDKTLCKGSYRVTQCYTATGSEVSINALVGCKMVLITGIGNPAGFITTTASLRITIVGKMLLPDHYEYKNPHVRQAILNLKKTSQAQRIVTTEKDFAKLRQFPELIDHLLVIRISFAPDQSCDELFEKISVRVKHRE